MTESSPTPTLSPRLSEAVERFAEALDARINARVVEILASAADRGTYQS